MNVPNRRRRPTHVLSILGAVLLCGAAGAARPNVVLVMTDDQGYGDVGVLGNTVIKTPTLDKLHAQSVRFTNFHVDPTCAPTRAALLTGRYSIRTGVWHTIAGHSMLRRDEQTLGDLFRANGYATGMFGKWHLGDNYPFRPWQRGFDEVICHGGGGVGQTPDFAGNDYFDDTYWHNGKAEKFTGYCTDVFFDGAMKFIDANKDRPFFCYLVPNAPHGPYLVADEYSKPYRDAGIPPNRANFYGMVTNIDDNLKRLLAHLDANGLTENTVFLFLTDNGTSGPWYPKEGKAFNDGMRGIKGSHYEGGHRVPCFVRWPGGGIRGGVDLPQLAAHIDLTPTLIDLCGLRRPMGPKLDGVSLAPLLRGQTDRWPERTLIVNNQRIARPAKWRYPTVMTQRWRLVNDTELYDMRADPGQKSNVAAQHAEIVGNLQGAYERWWRNVSWRIDEPIPIVIGSPHENPTLLTAHDWRAKKVPWHNDVIDEAPLLTGHWIVEPAREGMYEITLRQKRESLNFPIDGVQAGLRAGGQDQVQPVTQGATAVRFRTKLRRGVQRLEGWFQTAQGEMRGAYYARVRRLKQ